MSSPDLAIHKNKNQPCGYGTINSNSHHEQMQLFNTFGCQPTKQLRIYHFNQIEMCAAIDRYSKLSTISQTSVHNERNSFNTLSLYQIYESFFLYMYIFTCHFQKSRHS